MTEPKYNYGKLRGRIKEVLGTEGAYAKKINRSHNFLTNVFNGESYFSQKDITAGADALFIDESDIGLYFFNRQVHANETFLEGVSGCVGRKS